MADKENNSAAEVQHFLDELLLSFEEDKTYKQKILGETLRLLRGNHSKSDLKMMAKVLKEMRLGLEIFRLYQAWRKVSIFGSARIAKHDPRYIQTRDFAKSISDEGFMVITGGGPGMMQAANEGAGAKRSFGININLPMEQQPNPIVDGTPRHFDCQYFFTRKLFFLKESDAVVLTAGGFGTLDEGFETLTLLQTGRNPPIPVVLLEAPGDDFWGPFIRSWVRRLTQDGLISPQDQNLFFHTDCIATATSHIRDFYINYHSFRYVGNWVLLRLLNPLTHDALERLNAEFTDVLHQGTIEQVFEWPHNDDTCFKHLPRLRMRLKHHHINVLPQIIRRINALHNNNNALSP
ncbi:MAG: LOG family protein [Mariprofundaceae bacterium]|nr:LOG family protein [Mariprofundaceae bacterium]